VRDSRHTDFAVTVISPDDQGLRETFTARSKGELGRRFGELSEDLGPSLGDPDRLERFKTSVDCGRRFGMLCERWADVRRT
jgi:hypothetical protein